MDELSNLLDGDNVSSRCTEYIEAAIEAAIVADDMAELLLRLIKANGTGNEWYCAERVESYDPGPTQDALDPDAPWELYWTSPDGGGVLHAWTDIGPSAADDLGLPNHEIATQRLDYLKAWVIDLNATFRQAGTDIVIVPAVRNSANTTFPDFVLGSLNDKALRDASNQLQPLWDHFATNQPETLQHGMTWRQLQGDMMQRMTTHNAPPLVPQAYEFEYAWRQIDGEMAAANPNGYIER